MAINERFQQLAQKAAGELKIPWQWIYAQWAHETGGFTSALTTKHNFAGLTSVQGGYRTYESDDEFVNSYVNDFLKRKQYSGATSATNVDDFVRGLKNGGYFSDVYENYLYGVKYWLKETGETISWVDVKKDDIVKDSPGFLSSLWDYWAAIIKGDIEGAEKIKSDFASGDSPIASIPKTIEKGDNKAEEVKDYFPELFTGGLMVLVGVAAAVIGFFLMTRKEEVA